MTITSTRPWGMTRMTPHLAATPLPWVTTEIEESTQLAVYRDQGGRAIDITGATYATVTMSRPSDGSGNAAQVADDSNTDQR